MKSNDFITRLKRAHRRLNGCVAGHPKCTGYGHPGRDYSEGDIAGYSWANYLCLEPTMDEDFIKAACQKLETYYAGQSSLRDKLGRWVFYTVDHWGGAEIAINNPDKSLATHKLDYQYYYQNVPNMVFQTPLDQTTNSY